MKLLNYVLGIGLCLLGIVFLAWCLWRVEVYR